MLGKAIDLANKAHEGQTRKDGQTPYIVHLLGVMHLVAKHERCLDKEELEDVLSAAVLHDILEDTDTSETAVKKATNKKVLKIIKELTEDLSENNWYIRKLESIKKIRRMSYEAAIIKACDKLHNITDLLNSFERMGSDDSQDIQEHWSILGMFPENSYFTFIKAYRDLEFREDLPYYLLKDLAIKIDELKKYLPPWNLNTK